MLTLKKHNVVKQVESQEAADKLVGQGFTLVTKNEPEPESQDDKKGAAADGAANQKSGGGAAGKSKA